MAELNLQNKTEAEALASILKKNFEPKLIEIGKNDQDESVQALQAPGDFKLHSVKPLIDEYATAPKRRKGVHIATALDSFIALTNRMKDADSVLFANNDMAAPSLIAVLNFHKAGGDLDNTAVNLARYGDHRIDYELALSKEWQAWQQFNGEMLAQGDFAAFIEERISDVVAPDPDLLGTITDAATGGDFGDRSPKEQLAYLAKTLGGSFAKPGRLMELSRGLSVRENQSVKQVINTSTGEGRIQWEAVHTDDDGQPLTIPNLFLIAIPLFENTGAAWRMAVQLRYRLSQGRVKWVYNLYRAELVFAAAIKGACERAQAETDLPLYLGKPAAA